MRLTRSSLRTECEPFYRGVQGLFTARLFPNCHMARGAACAKTRYVA